MAAATTQQRNLLPWTLTVQCASLERHAQDKCCKTILLGAETDWYLDTIFSYVSKNRRFPSSRCVKVSAVWYREPHVWTQSGGSVAPILDEDDVLHSYLEKL